jgi:hypothetical protein
MLIQLTNSHWKDSFPWIELQDYQHWDFAGVDGLQVAQALFGQGVTRIAPFQSLDVDVADYTCSVLRLCEGNFRVGVQGDGSGFQAAIKQAQIGRRVWVKQLPWLQIMAIPESTGLMLLPTVAIAKPPHRVIGLQPNCAACARIENQSALIWRHTWSGQPVFELHMAK